MTPLDLLTRARRVSLDLSHSLSSFGTTQSSSSGGGSRGVFWSGQPVILSDYAHNGYEMHTASQDDDRPTNRFYRFLTSSRSRSRSKHSTSHDHQPHTSQLTQTDPSHSRESTWSSRTSDRGRSSNRSSGKPLNILPSRPLSSTTTATNTTVTPPTPKGKRRMPQPPSTAPPPSHAEPLQENSDLSSVPPGSTPKSRPSTRRKLRNIFGIHSRKSSISSSRATSPSPARGPSIQHLEVPPLPPPYPQSDTFTSHDLSKFSRAQSPDPISSSSRPQSPFSIPPQSSHQHDPLTSSVSTTASSTSKIEHITKFFSSTKPLLNPRRGSTTSLSTPPSSSDSILPTVSGPTKYKRASTSAVTDAHPTNIHPHSHSHSRHGHSQSRNRDASSSSKATATSEASASAAGTNGTTPPPPPPPKHHQTGGSLSRSTTGSTRMSHRKDSLDSTHRYRPLVIVDEENERESLVVEGQSSSPKGKGKDIIVLPGSVSAIRVAGKRRDSDTSDTRNPSRTRNGGVHQTTKSPKQVSIRATKHGSFDFERPSWVTGGLMRSLSGHSRQNGNEESWEGGGSNGNGRTKSRGSEPDHHERKRNGGLPSRQLSQRTPPSKTVTLQTDDTHRNGKGLSSSLGKSSGRRALGAGVTRLVGLAHGPFSFEPAVPSPTLSHQGTHTPPTPPSVVDSETDTPRKRDNRDKRKKGEKVRKEEDLSRSTSIKSKITEPDSILSSSTGYSRSTARGRSLDLGLGLSWAPSKVREDVLLPAGTFATRHSHSASSRKGVSKHVEFEEKERTKVGQEIAEVFRKVLDEDAFIAFKHYVHQFDAHEIPFDGPTGIVTRIERLLSKASTLGPEDQRNLMNKLIRVILHNV
ncbi:hypothetical protein L218DRAFT_994937 [Marasmius fiardii PR-910]|nr:hypothetical protein L218DRAFT_994937 [Marasmius fiardii PR-910]